MKKIILVMLMGLMVLPSFAHSLKGKTKHRRKQQTEVVSEVRPIHRERWVERNGKYYVIVSRTTITADDYRKILDSNR
jgi:hypothetical protein